MDKDWAFPDPLSAFEPKKDILKKVFADSIALAAYAQYKRSHIVEKNENLWLPHFALLFSKIIKDLRAAGSVSFVLVFEVWWQLWRMNPMYLAMGYHSNRENFIEMVAAIMPFINGEKKLRLKLLVADDDQEKWCLVTEETKA